MGLTEAEIEARFKELVALLKAQSPDRIEALLEELEREARNEEISDVSKGNKGPKGGADQDSPDNR